MPLHFSVWKFHLRISAIDCRVRTSIWQPVDLNLNICFTTLLFTFWFLFKAPSPTHWSLSSSEDTLKSVKEQCLFSLELLAPEGWWNLHPWRCWDFRQSPEKHHQSWLCSEQGLDQMTFRDLSCSVRIREIIKKSTFISVRVRLMLLIFSPEEM